MEQDRCAGQLIVSTLLKDLPPELDLMHYFDGHPHADTAMCSCLLAHSSTVACGPLGTELAQYGLFPAQIVDVLAAISRVIGRYKSDHQLSDSTAIRHLAIVEEIVNITDLDSIIAYRLLMWLCAVAAIKPLIIPGYIFRRDGAYWWALPGGIYTNHVNDLYEPWSTLAD